MGAITNREKEYKDLERTPEQGATFISLEAQGDEQKMIAVTFVRIGMIGSSNLIEGLLDERASRTDISIRSVSSGCNMDEKEAVDVTKLACAIPSDLYVLVSPNASMPGPRTACQMLKETMKPLIVISDEPTKKMAASLERAGLGYIIVTGDPMIGARQGFLDPTEMAIFNSDIVRVLAITGVYRLLHAELDRVITQLKKGGPIQVPHIVVDDKKAIEYSGIENPYARAKAAASFEAARQVGRLSSEGCFRAKSRRRYLSLVAAAHELMRRSALLADEAREIEKSRDSVERVVHLSKGALATKKRLLGRLSKPHSVQDAHSETNTSS